MKSNRSKWWLACVVGCLLGLGGRVAEAGPVFWVNGDGNWEDPANWSSNPYLPQRLDDVTIDVDGALVRTITLNSGYPSIRSLLCKENLVVSGADLEIAFDGQIDGDLTISTRTLTVNGGAFNANGASTFDRGSLHAYEGNFNANGATTADRSSFYAYFGSQVKLPNLTSLTVGGHSDNSLFAASPGGLLDISSLASLTTLDGDWRLSIQAWNSATVDAKNLTGNSAGNGTISVTSGGWGSVVDLPGLTSLHGNPAGYGSASLSASDGGVIQLPAGSPMTLNTVALTANGSGTQIVLPAGSSLLGTSMYASSGSTLGLPPGTTYLVQSYNYDVFQASGAGSLIDLSALAGTLAGRVGSEPSSWTVNINAFGGGRVNASNLVGNSRDDGAINVHSRGAGSVADLSSLTSLYGFADYRTSSLKAEDGGVILLPSTPMTLWSVKLYASDGSTVVLPGGSSLYRVGMVARNGSTLALPPGAKYTVGDYSDGYFLAHGFGSRLDLSELTGTLTGSEGTEGTRKYWTISVQALTGGTVDLSNFAGNASYDGAMSVEARGVGSRVDMSSLTSLYGHPGWYRNSQLSATDGGVIQLPSTGTTTLTDVWTDTGTGGTIAAHTIELRTGCTLSGSGTLRANLISSGGTVAPGLTPGVLTIAGDYAQGPGGSLNIQITGTAPGQFDRLLVTDHTALDGTLTLWVSDVGKFEIDPSTTLTILQAGSLSGVFAGLPNGSIAWEESGGDNDKLFIFYSGTAVTLAGAVPEPATWVLLASLGAMGLVTCARRRRAALR